MAVICKRCRRQYDITLFEYGHTVECECGATVSLDAEIEMGKTGTGEGSPEAGRSARAAPSGEEATSNDPGQPEQAGVGYLTPATDDDLWLYVIRHGRTVWNKDGRLQGQLDVELSDEGREQARKAAAALADIPFVAAYTSDLRRAAETAEIILGGRAVPLRRTPALREEEYGGWTGKTYAEIARRWPEQCEERERDRVHARPEGGETLGELQARVVAKLDEIAAAHASGKVLVVTHGGPAFVFFSKVMAPHGRLGGNFSVKNCALNIVARTRFGWKLMLLNDECHL
jgi:broad specificity phosphatase PhoE